MITLTVITRSKFLSTMKNKDFFFSRFDIRHLAALQRLQQLLPDHRRPRPSPEDRSRCQVSSKQSFYSAKTHVFKVMK